MDLRQLHTFLEVADAESISKAAALLHIAQPAVSRQVRLLEQELGVSLLFRHGRGVTPTPAGKVLAEQARRVLQAAQFARDAVRAFEAEPSGALSFGVPSSLSLVLLPILGLNFRKNYPKVRLHLVEGFSGSIHEWILDGRLDLAILYDAAAMGNLIATPLLEEAMVLVGPACRFGLKETVTLAALAEFPLALPARPHRLRLQIDNLIARARRTVEPVIEIDALSALLEVVACEDVYTILPYSSVEAMVEHGGVSVASIAEEQAKRRLYLARPTARPLTPAGLALERSVVTLIQDRAERYRWRPLAAP